jgi:O-antigen/teichoic acid export membrane protein
LPAAPPRLRRHSFGTRYLTLFASETFSKLCVLSAFAYLARVLAPAEYGTVELALSITVFFVLGVESGMGLYGARLISAAPERIPQLVPQVMLLRLLLGLPAYALMLAAAARYRATGLGILAVYGIAVLLTPFLTQWVFQGLRQMHWVAAGTATRSVTFLVVVLLFVGPGSDVRRVAMAEVAGIGALAMFNELILHGRLRVRLDWRGLVAGARHVFRDVWFMGISDFTWACLWYSPALVIGWVAAGGDEQVAWVGAAVRIVLALHTFVFLYFFNLLPDLARELASSLDGWRDVMHRSLATSMWPAALVAVGGTLIAPLLIPAVYGEAFQPAVVPFQIAIWMIPLTWFSGHFRFSLIAHGKQRWEFAVSLATAVVTVGTGLIFARRYGSAGAAGALVVGGAVNAALAVVACQRRVGTVSIVRSAGRVAAAAAISLAAGAAIQPAAGILAGATVATLLYCGLALRQQEVLTAVRGWLAR